MLFTQVVMGLPTMACSECKGGILHNDSHKSSVPDINLTSQMELEQPKVEPADDHLFPSRWKT
jgi:hypothetical protein